MEKGTQSPGGCSTTAPRVGEGWTVVMEKDMKIKGFENEGEEVVWEPGVP